MPALNYHGWYDTAYRFRIPVSVDVTGGGTGNPLVADASLTMPKDYSAFWSNVLVSGNDVLFTEADGLTPITAANATALVVSSFSKPNRTGTWSLEGVRVGNGFPFENNAHNMLWLYYGHAGASSSAFGSAGSPSPKVTRVSTVEPRTVVPMRSHRPGETTPPVEVAKAAGEVVRVALEFAPSLPRRARGPYQGRAVSDCIASLTVTSEQSGSTASPGVVTASYALWLSETRVSIQLSGGTSGQAYTVVATAKTVRGETLDRRFVVRVQDTQE